VSERGWAGWRWMFSWMVSKPSHSASFELFFILLLSNKLNWVKDT
jgi:hypothetical protein